MTSWMVVKPCEKRADAPGPKRASASGMIRTERDAGQGGTGMALMGCPGIGAGASREATRRSRAAFKTIMSSALPPWSGWHLSASLVYPALMIFFSHSPGIVAPIYRVRKFLLRDLSRGSADGNPELLRHFPCRSNTARH